MEIIKATGHSVTSTLLEGPQTGSDQTGSDPEEPRILGFSFKSIEYCHFFQGAFSEKKFSEKKNTLPRLYVFYVMSIPFL